MKKAAVFLLSVMMAAALAACTAPASPESPPSSQSPSSSSESISQSQSHPVVLESSSSPESQAAASSDSATTSSNTPSESEPESSSAPLPPPESGSEAAPSTEEGSEKEEQPVEGRILVAYFSATGTTKPLAEYAADILGADLYEITAAEPYTDADLAYYTGGRADQEQNDSSARPGISGSVEDMAQYDTILLGYPIWHGQAPRIISTFLESYDFSGKTIIPFCTSHSSGVGSSASNLHSLCSDETVWKNGTRFAGGTTKAEIAAWLDSVLPNR